MNNLITTSGLTKSYGNFTAVDGVNMTLQKGEIYGLVGKNGAGKTTLFRMLLGITMPSSGAISIMGSTDTLTLNKARQNIGFMVDAKFFPYLNAYENIEYFRKLKGIVDEQETVRVIKLAGLHGITKKYKSFSMGMKQRLALANALLGKPDIVILDEPVNGLDPQGIVEFRKLILRLNQEQGTTFVISSHILSELALLADRFGIIHRGKLVEEITRDELHAKSQTGIVLQVDAPEKAVTLLEEKLNIKQYQVNGNQEILITDQDVVTADIAEILVLAGLRLQKLAHLESTFEDYFISITGGSSNV